MLAIQFGIEDAVEPCLGLGIIALADGSNEDVAQRGLLKDCAEDIKNGSAERGAFIFQLFKEAEVNVTLAGVMGNEIPEVADLALADAVNPSKSLFEPVGVPGQIVIDHEVRTLEVDPFSGGVGRQEDQHFGIAGK